MTIHLKIQTIIKVRYKIVGLFDFLSKLADALPDVEEDDDYDVFADDSSSSSRKTTSKPANKPATQPKKLNYYWYCSSCGKTYYPTPGKPTPDLRQPCKKRYNNQSHNWRKMSF